MLRERRARPARPRVARKRSVSATSWTRTRTGRVRAASAQRAAAASDSGSRSETGAPATVPRNALRDAPTTSGTPGGARRSSAPRRAKFCSGVLPNPRPGSRKIFSARIPEEIARSRASPRSAATSATTSVNEDSSKVEEGVPRQWLSTRAAPRLATSSRRSFGTSRPVTTFTMSAPASSAARATSTRRVSTERGRDGRVLEGDERGRAALGRSPF